MGTFEGTLDFAIQREQQAYIFYKTLAGIVTAEQMRTTLLSFAEEELRHKEILSAMKGQKAGPPDEKIPDLNISDDVSDVEPTPDMGYEDALVIAMKKETNSFRLYRDLAAITRNEELKNTFLTLAQEEAKHKLHFETEYKKITTNTHDTS
jgi:rubrerythrin